MQTTTVAQMLTRYDALFIDAYGVLVNASGILDGAQDFLATLRREKMPFCIVTNDASRLPENIAARFASLGLDIHVDEIVSSASLLTDFFAREKLQGHTTCVLGPEDAHEYVRRAGGTAVAPTDAKATDAHAIVVCDVGGANMQRDLTALINISVARIDAGKPLQLVLCNPDIIYPSGKNTYGITSGALMLVLEAALKSRYAAANMPRITRLGKPFAHIFDAAKKRTGGARLALIGDQLGTDIAGANAYGIDSILVGTGLTEVNADSQLQPEPTYYLPKVGP